jgi:hypothetical protein
LRLDFSSAPTGEAWQAGREDIESSSAVRMGRRAKPPWPHALRASATKAPGLHHLVVVNYRAAAAPPQARADRSNLEDTTCWRDRGVVGRIFLSSGPPQDQQCEAAMAAFAKSWRRDAAVPPSGSRKADRSYDQC